MAKVIKVKNVHIGQGRPKICALVMGETKEEIFERARRSNECDCDMIEFRADYYPGITDINEAKSLLQELRKIVRKPMIFTFRTIKEGGNRAVDQEYYKALLKMVAICNYAELIDVEASSMDDVSEFVDDLKEFGAYIILSKHDFFETPGRDEILKIFMDMQKTGADIIKVAFMPNSKKDVLNLINATEEMTSNYASCPVVAISMGHLGMVTRILGEFLESAITFASIDKSSAPGQINIDSLNQVLSVIHDNYKKVFLIGFMGTGKTAVANGLNQVYGLKKIDLDAYIEQKEGMTISDMFASKSEEYFRDKETKYLKQILKKNYQVVSLGGGSVLREENVEQIKEKGLIVLLNAKPETIAKRLENDKTRPLLSGNMDLDYIRNLMEQRKNRYHAVADIVIETDESTIAEICKEIIDSIGFNG